MKKNKIVITILVAVIILSLAILLTACNDNTDSPIRIFAEMPNNIRAGDFVLGESAVIFEYQGGRRERIAITNNMLSEDDFAKLSTPGKHTVTINYSDDSSVQATINILQSATHDAVINKIIKGIQLAAPQNNINGEIELSLHYQFGNLPRKEYNVKLKFTLDIDEFDGAENYLEVEIAEDGIVVLGLYYKDNLDERPYMYVKVDGVFTELWQKTQHKMLSVSADPYFGTASIPDEFASFEEIIGLVMSLMGEDIISAINVESLVNTVINLLLSGAAVAVDDSTAVIGLDLETVLESIAVKFALLAVTPAANEFLDAIGSPIDFAKALKIANLSPLKITADFNESGAINRLEMTDSFGRAQTNNNVISIYEAGVVDAALNIKTIRITADDSSFDLPSDKGLETWEEGDLSFERWLLYQYREMIGYFEDYVPPIRHGIEAEIDVRYADTDETGEYNLLDIYRPIAEKQEDGELNSLPVIINIHGGGWVHGNKESVSSYCQYLALQGFAVVNINYHLMPDAFMPVPMQDVFAVFNFVMENAEQYGFDRDNVFLTGDSAGGHYVMLALSILVDEDLQEAFGVETDITIKAAGVNSTGFSFTNVVALPIPFAHYYVNQFFTDESPYTAYRDDPRYKTMADALSLENNKLDRFPPMFVSSAHADLFKSHSDRLVAELEKYDIQHIYDYRTQNDGDNPEGFLLGHDFNVAAPDWTVSRAVNDRLCEFFLSQVDK